MIILNCIYEEQHIANNILKYGEKDPYINMGNYEKHKFEEKIKIKLTEYSYEQDKKYTYNLYISCSQIITHTEEEIIIKKKIIDSCRYNYGLNVLGLENNYPDYQKILEKKEESYYILLL